MRFWQTLTHFKEKLRRVRERSINGKELVLFVLSLFKVLSPSNYDLRFVKITKNISPVGHYGNLTRTDSVLQTFD